MNIEVIISAYNNHRDLKLALEGYRLQSDKNFSIAIADDGSGPEVKMLIDNYAKLLTIRHVWHEDLGFRKTKILNKAIASSNAEHIIFADDDCIPAIDFIQDHRYFASKESFTVGVRAYLKEELSNKFRKGHYDVLKLQNGLWLLYESVIGKSKKPEQTIRYPDVLLPIVMRLKPRMHRFGSNLAVSRDNLLKVNGFDEDYEGWGFEDTDLVWRLTQLGLLQVGKLGRCRQYHLHHEQRERNSKAGALYSSKSALGSSWCKNGLIKE